MGYSSKHPALFDPAHEDPQLAALRAAVAGRDWVAVRECLQSVTDQDDLSFLVANAADVADSEDWLADICLEEPDSTLAALMRGARAVKWAWEARGHDLARYVRPGQFRLFFERLRVAEDCLQAVVRREPGNACAWSQLVTIARGLQLGLAKSQERFDGAIAACPHHLDAHREMLQNTCAKWQGSHEAMLAFAEAAAARAPEGSPLPVLVAQAHIERGDPGMTADEWAAYLGTPAVRRSIRAAADRSIFHPAYRRTRDWVSVHNTFALALSAVRDFAGAAEAFRTVDGRVSEMPWLRIDVNPVRPFSTAQRYVVTRALVARPVSAGAAAWYRALLRRRRSAAGR